MKKQWILAVGAAVVLLALVLGLAAFTGARTGEVMGVIASSGDAGVVARDQRLTRGTITVYRVLAPEDSWLVVHEAGAAGMPGMRVGLVHVKAGLSKDVIVRLVLTMPTRRLLVALHVDGGTRGEFEFDMDDLEQSTDKPIYADGTPVASMLRLQ